MVKKGITISEFIIIINRMVQSKLLQHKLMEAKSVAWEVMLHKLPMIWS